MSDLLHLLPQIDSKDGPWLLITLVGATGSTYRNVGAHLLLSPTHQVGMISGGCLEAEVRARCLPLFEGPSQALKMTIDTRHLLGCDGRVTLLAERLPEGLVERIARVAQDRQAIWLYSHSPGPGWRPTSEAVTAAPLLRHEVSPPIRLLVFGSGPGSIPLLEMARILKWEAVSLVMGSDPALRSQSGHRDWKVLARPGEAPNWVDSRTACVVMNHHVGRDTELLHALWDSETPFLGLLGSRKRRDQILERLAFHAQQPIDPTTRRLYAPVGLDLQAEGAEEIALEVCSQIQLKFARASRKKLRSVIKERCDSAQLSAGLESSAS